MSNAQLTPEQLAAENALICEFLGWKRCSSSECSGFIDSDGDHHYDVTFTSWADAGLILEALSARECKSAVGDKSISGSWWCTVGPICELRDTGPAAVRAAALAYIRSQS